MNPFHILIESYIYDNFYDWLIHYAPEPFTFERLDFQNPPDHFYQSLANADAILGEPTLQSCHHEVAKRLQIIQTIRAGYDQVNLTLAKKFGVLVGNNGGANAISVAEHVFLMLLAWFRQFETQQNQVRQGQWSNIKENNQELFGKILGIVGLGFVGKAVARLANVFGMTCLYYDILDQQTDQEQLKFVSFQELLKQSEIITLHVPLTSLTQRMIDKQVLKQMRSDAILVNTSRGAIVHEQDLCRALKSGLIAGACLDVFESEPLATNSSLLQQSHVILTPHAAPSKQSRPRTIENAMANLKQVYHQKPLLYEAIDYEMVANPMK